jgi:hypothetical protein
VIGAADTCSYCEGEGDPAEVESVNQTEYAQWPSIIANGIALPDDVTAPGRGTASLTITLSVDDKARQAGSDVMQLARDVIAQYPKESSVRELARLAREFDDIVLRMPELHDFFDRLATEGDWRAMARITGEGRRGRPFSSPLYLVGLVDRVCEQFDWPVCRAAAWLAAKYQAELHKGARAIENDYSRFKEIYDRKFGCRFVPPGVLLQGRPAASTRR